LTTDDQPAHRLYLCDEDTGTETEIKSTHIRKWHVSVMSEFFSFISTHNAQRRPHPQWPLLPIIFDLAAVIAPKQQQQQQQPLRPQQP
jgi:hypothetical protein